MRPKAIDIKILEDYQLEILFNNGERRIFDVNPYFKFKLFRDLTNKKEFAKVKASGLSIRWDNGADICPEELYKNSKPIDMEE